MGKTASEGGAVPAASYIFFMKCPPSAYLLFFYIKKEGGGPLEAQLALPSLSPAAAQAKAKAKPARPSLPP